MVPFVLVQDAVVFKEVKQLAFVYLDASCLSVYLALTSCWTKVVLAIIVSTSH